MVKGDHGPDACRLGVSVLVDALTLAGIAHDIGPGGKDLHRVLGGLPMSPELVDFYRTAGTGLPAHIPAPLGGISMFGIAALVAAQAGYRWDAGRHPLDGWPHAWVVVATHEGDPFIADTGVDGTPVGVAVHGTGTWQPHWIAPTFADFLTLLAAFVHGYVVDYLRVDEEPTDDELPYLATVKARLTALAPDINVEPFLTYLSI